MIGVVLAEDQTLAQRAAAAVIVQYEPLDAVITIKVCTDRCRCVRVCVCVCVVLSLIHISEPTRQ